MAICNSFMYVWKEISFWTFSLFGVTTQLGPRPSLNDTQTHTHTHTHKLSWLSVGLLWTGDQLVTEAATYTTPNKHKRRTSLCSEVFEPAIPGTQRPQTYALVQCFSTAGPRKILLELITNLNVILYLSTCHTVHIIELLLFMIMP